MSSDPRQASSQEIRIKVTKHVLLAITVQMPIAPSPPGDRDRHAMLAQVDPQAD